MKPAVLITGGTGFIGRNLVEAFSDRYTLLAPRRAEMDLLDPESVSAYFQTHSVDVLVHSATTPGHRAAKDPQLVLQSNMAIFFNLMACRGRFGKWINLGSGSEYDMRHYLPRMSEDYFGVHTPVDPAGFSKFMASRFLEADANAWTLRLFGVFGKYEDYEIRFISNAICKALLGRPITLRQNRRFDYLYIDDLIPVLTYFIENRAPEKVYNITPDVTVDLLSCAETVRALSGHSDLPIQVATPGWGTEYSGNNARLKRVLPEVRWTPIDQAIGSLWNWYVAHRNDIHLERLLVDK